MKTETFPPELVYDTTLAIQVIATYQTWKWTNLTESLSNGRSGLVCSLLQWINDQYHTQRRRAIWRLYWQASQGQQWAILDSSMVLHGAFWRGNLEGLMWSLMRNCRVFAKQVRWNLTTQQVWSVYQLLFWSLWKCSKSTSRLVIWNQARHCIWQ